MSQFDQLTVNSKEFSTNPLRPDLVARMQSLEMGIRRNTEGIVEKRQESIAEAAKALQASIKAQLEKIFLRHQKRLENIEEAKQKGANADLVLTNEIAEGFLDEDLDALRIVIEKGL